MMPNGSDSSGNRTAPQTRAAQSTQNSGAKAGAGITTVRRRVPEDKRPIGITTSGAKKPKIGRGLIFWMVWLTIILVVMVVWAVLLSKLGGYLEEYESIQPQHEAERIFGEYFTDYKTIAANASNLALSDFEDMAAVVAYMSELYGEADPAAWSLNKAISAEIGTLKYTVSAKGKSIADFTLVKTGEVNEATGEPLYTLGRIRISFAPAKGASIYAPINAIVSVNGTELGEEYHFGDPVVLAEQVYYPTGDESARTMQNYFVGGLYAAPTVTVTSADGSVEYTLQQDAEKASWRADGDYIDRLVQSYNQKIEDERRAEEERLQRECEEIRTMLAGKAVEGLQMYARWMQYDATTAQRNKYFVPNCEFLRSIAGTNPSAFVWQHKGYRFDDVVDDEYKYLNEEKTEISCHIKMMQVLLEVNDPMMGSDEKPEWNNAIDSTVLMRLVDGVWLIYDIQNN